MHYGFSLGKPLNFVARPDWNQTLRVATATAGKGGMEPSCLAPSRRSGGGVLDCVLPIERQVYVRISRGGIRN